MIEAEKFLRSRKVGESAIDHYRTKKLIRGMDRKNILSLSHDVGLSETVIDAIYYDTYAAKQLGSITCQAVLLWFENKEK